MGLGRSFKTRHVEMWNASEKEVMRTNRRKNGNMKKIA